MYHLNSLRSGAILGEGCRVEEGAVVGEDAVLGPGCYIGPDCGVGSGAELGPGVALLDRTRLPGKQMPAMVGAGTKVGGGAIVAGVKVGSDAVVAAGEPKRSIGTSRDVWRTTFPTMLSGWGAGSRGGWMGRRGSRARVVWRAGRSSRRRCAPG